MKLLIGALAYLAFVGTLLAGTFTSISSVERSRPDDGPVFARGDDGPSRNVTEERKVDPNRVPVWIAATPKYEYTPVPIEVRTRHSVIIGSQARDAMARAPLQARPARQELARQDLQRVAAPRRANSTRDNDPFYRD